MIKTRLFLLYRLAQLGRIPLKRRNISCAVEGISIRIQRQEMEIDEKDREIGRLRGIIQAHQNQAQAWLLDPRTEVEVPRTALEAIAKDSRKGG